MQYTSRAIGESFAREIVGLQLWEKPSAETVEELRALWTEQGVPVFRRQAISEHAYERATKLVERHPPLQ